MTVSSRAILTFYTHAGNVVRLSIPRARMDNTAPEAQAAMEAILASEAVVTGDGMPRTIRGVELVETQRQILTA